MTLQSDVDQEYFEPVEIQEWYDIGDLIKIRKDFSALVRKNKAQDERIKQLEKLLVEHLGSQYWCSTTNEWYTATYTYADMLTRLRKIKELEERTNTYADIRSWLDR